MTRASINARFHVRLEALGCTPKGNAANANPIAIQDCFDRMAAFNKDTHKPGYCINEKTQAALAYLDCSPS